MSVIYINRKHEYQIDDLKLKIDEIKNDMEKRFEVRSEWVNDQNLKFRRKGLSGSIVIDNFNFQLKINLSLMYRMIGTQIENEIENVVNKHLQ